MGFANLGKQQQTSPSKFIVEVWPCSNLCLRSLAAEAQHTQSTHLVEKIDERSSFVSLEVPGDVDFGWRAQEGPNF